ncbi:unnamed protein product [Caenorhabditis angaria]|uniref:Uncharacterized protein n=1 Tax=Caenorhabditis angaria TaxID=860376 RepID=A0A9P1N8J0_9PELO|nr:unnamed protein product [Caenorhabditis angaria]
MMMENNIDFNMKQRLEDLQVQLALSQDKLQVRENVIAQLEEEIQGKKILIFEQNHLISILESEAASQQQHMQAIKCDNNNKYDTESLASESEITVIEREIVASSSSTSPCSSEKSMPTSSSDIFRTGECIKNCRCQHKFEQAMVERERLELQNEQLLKQWEEALEYVSSVQRQLQEEITRNTTLKHQMNERERNDIVEIPRNVMNLIAFIVVIIGFVLYRL